MKKNLQNLNSMNEVKEIIDGKGIDKVPEWGLLAPKMMEYLLTMKQRGFSINAVRIVLILIANLKEKQMLFRGKDKYIQLDLFDNEWMNVDNDKQFSTQFNFKFKDFLPKGSKNNGLVKKGLDELVERIDEITIPMVDKQGKVRDIKIKTAFISSYIMEEGNGFKLLINKYWYKLMIDVTNSYNAWVTDVTFRLSYNALMFYWYLKSLPEIKSTSDNYNDYKIVKDELGNAVKAMKGTRVKKENFVQIFGSDWIYDSDIRRKILNPVIDELNKKADISAGFKIENGIITLVTYENTKELIKKELTGIDESKIRAAITYKKKNNQLDAICTVMILEIYIKYTYGIVYKATQRKSELRGLKGREYLEVFHNLVENYVKLKRVDLKEVGYENPMELRKKIKVRFENK